MRDLGDSFAAGEPPAGLQPQPLTPLLLGGRVPAPLCIPHALVILRQAADVTTRSLQVNPGYSPWVFHGVDVQISNELIFLKVSSCVCEFTHTATTRIRLQMMTTRRELLEASDQTIEDALLHAHPMVLRGLVYQLTGDESLASVKVSSVEAALQEMKVIADPADVAMIRSKAATFLKSCRDAGADEDPDRADGTATAKPESDCGSGRSGIRA